MKEHHILVVGGNRGLGKALADEYAKAHKTVYATARHEAPKADNGIYWIPQIDITNERAGIRVAASYGSSDPIDVLIIAAGYFAKETLGSLDYSKQVEMYKTAAIGPLFLIQHLVEKQLLKKGSRIILVSGESGSIALRDGGRGGNYGGHCSKAAVNMMGKLLSVDLEPKGIPVAIVHTGYLRKQNQDGSFEYSDKNAITPELAADTLRKWIHDFDMSKTGQFWSIRGPEGIKAAERLLGKDKLITPMQLPW